MAFGSGGRETPVAERRRKLVVLGVSSLILVSMVVALTVGMHASDKTETSNRDDVSTSIKAVCQSTDYQKTCIDSLSSAAPNTSDPKELVRAAFEVAIKQIEIAANNSTVLRDLQKDPKAKAALKSCEDLAARSVMDLRRSFDRMGEFSIDDVEDMLSNLKIWLSAAMTYEETCLDGFEDIPGDAGDKMRKALKMAMELTSNGLAMVTEISSVFDSLNFSATRRRLMSMNMSIFGHDFQLPDWFNEHAEARSILEDKDDKKHKSKKVKPIKADIVVAKDGSGNFTTINEALPHIPPKGKHKFIIYVKEGVYDEIVHFKSNMTHVILIGDGPTKTRVTGNLNWLDGTPTYQTPTVVVGGDYFIAKDIGFENTAGPSKHQAVALRVSADKAIFYNCHMDAYQDTLYAHTYRQYYRDCTISGTVDFIFGDSAAILQNCILVIRKPNDDQQCIVTAQGRKDMRQPTGLVLQNCTFVADPAYYPFRHTLKSYLGRPWKEFSRTIIMESYIDEFIQPQGWMVWNLSNFGLDTSFYTEFNNRGPGAGKQQRVQWKGIKELPGSRVERFTADKFIEGKSWVPHTKVPYVGGFIFPVPKDDPKLGYSEYSPEEDKDAGQKRHKSDYKMPSPPSADGKDKDEDKDEDKDKDKDKDKNGKSTHNPKIPESQISEAPAASPVGAPGEPQVSPIFLSLFKREQDKKNKTKSHESSSKKGGHHGSSDSKKNHDESSSDSDNSKGKSSSNSDSSKDKSSSNSDSSKDKSSPNSDSSKDKSSSNSDSSKDKSSSNSDSSKDKSSSNSDNSKDKSSSNSDSNKDKSSSNSDNSKGKSSSNSDSSKGKSSSNSDSSKGKSSSNSDSSKGKSSSNSDSSKDKLSSNYDSSKGKGGASSGDDHDSSNYKAKDKAKAQAQAPPSQTQTPSANKNDKNQAGNEQQPTTPESSKKHHGSKSKHGKKHHSATGPDGVPAIPPPSPPSDREGESRDGETILPPPPTATPIDQEAASAPAKEETNEISSAPVPSPAASPESSITTDSESIFPSLFFRGF